MIVTLPSEESALISDITALVNQVYEESEKGLWVEGATRTDPDEIAALLAAGELAGTYRDGRLAGVVRHCALDDETGEFGMLAADPAMRGQGIGTALVAHCEQEARAAGRRFMQLELLVPRDGTLASKEFLAAWYGRIGYRLTGLGAMEEQHPSLVPLLAVPTDYRVYRKSLS